MDEDQKVLPHYASSNDPLVYVLQKKQEGFNVKYMGAIENNAAPEDMAGFDADAPEIASSGKKNKISEVLEE